MLVVDDLTTLPVFTEETIIEQLQRRYGADTIYTNIGSILISVNPYKDLPLYSSDILRSYSTSSDGVRPAPHVFEIAAAALRGIREDNRPQSVVISGESGAGKTEASKIILRYLSEMAGGNDSRIEEMILESNPLLEAMGNAKTLRNDNSSRFGKFMEVTLDSGRVSGARLTSYLLEKSRVVNLAKGERSYHIFYQMLAGLSREERLDLKLGDMQSYAYLSQSGSYTVDGVDDGVNFQKTRSAFRSLQISDYDVSQIFRLLSTILNLGNIKLVAHPDQDTTLIENPAQLELTSSLMQVAPAVLQHAITHRSVTVVGETSYIPLRQEDSMRIRDALAKHLYARLFNWLLGPINEALFTSSSNVTIGILDIFGFEVFEENLFEQLTINYANEKLQQHFIGHIFKQEQQEYLSEGISFENVEFVDNARTLQLIEGKRGILPELDQQVIIPQGNDDSFVRSLHEQFGRDHECYRVNPRYSECFTIVHYAGEVTYKSVGMVEKDRDSLHTLCVEAMMSSENNLMLLLFEHDGVEPENSTKRRETLATQFRSQLSQLVKKLNDSNPHFIRCIKPNTRKASDDFDSEMILRQLSYAGLFEALRVRKAGYAYRKLFKDFAQRWAIVYESRTHKALPRGDYRTMCQMIVASMQGSLPDNEIQIGRTKVFFNERAKQTLDASKEGAVVTSVRTMQRWVRGHLARVRVRRLKAEREARLKAEREAKQVQAMNTRLDNAMVSGDLDKVKSVIKKAVVLTNKTGKQILSINRARSLISKLEEEIVIAGMLNDAVEQRNEKLLRQAIATADEKNVLESCNINELADAYARAKKTLAALTAPAAPPSPRQRRRQQRQQFTSPSPASPITGSNGDRNPLLEADLHRLQVVLVEGDLAAIEELFVLGDFADLSPSPKAVEQARQELFEYWKNQIAVLLSSVRAFEFPDADTSALAREFTQVGLPNISVTGVARDLVVASVEEILDSLINKVVDAGYYRHPGIRKDIQLASEFLAQQEAVRTGQLVGDILRRRMEEYEQRHDNKSYSYSKVPSRKKSVVPTIGLPYAPTQQQIGALLKSAETFISAPITGIDKVLSNTPGFENIDTERRAMPVRALTSKVLNRTEDLLGKLLAELDASGKLDDPTLQDEVARARAFLAMQAAQRTPKSAVAGGGGGPEKMFREEDDLGSSPQYARGAASRSFAEDVSAQFSMRDVAASQQRRPIAEDVTSQYSRGSAASRFTLTGAGPPGPLSARPQFGAIQSSLMLGPPGARGAPAGNYNNYNTYNSTLPGAADATPFVTDQSFGGRRPLAPERALAPMQRNPPSRSVVQSRGGFRGGRVPMQQSQPQAAGQQAAASGAEREDTMNTMSFSLLGSQPGEFYGFSRALNDFPKQPRVHFGSVVEMPMSPMAPASREPMSMDDQGYADQGYGYGNQSYMEAPVLVEDAETNSTPLQNEIRGFKLSKLKQAEAKPATPKAPVKSIFDLIKERRQFVGNSSAKSGFSRRTTLLSDVSDWTTADTVVANVVYTSTKKVSRPSSPNSSASDDDADSRMSTVSSRSTGPRKPLKVTRAPTLFSNNPKPSLKLESPKANVFYTSTTKVSRPSLPDSSASDDDDGSRMSTVSSRSSGPRRPLKVTRAPTLFSNNPKPSLKLESPNANPSGSIITSSLPKKKKWPPEPDVSDGVVTSSPATKVVSPKSSPSGDEDNVTSSVAAEKSPQKSNLTVVVAASSPTKESSPKSNAESTVAPPSPPTTSPKSNADSAVAPASPPSKAASPKSNADSAVAPASPPSKSASPKSNGDSAVAPASPPSKASSPKSNTTSTVAPPSPPAQAASPRSNADSPVASPSPPTEESSPKSNTVTTLSPPSPPPEAVSRAATPGESPYRAGTLKPSYTDTGSDIDDILSLSETSISAKSELKRVSTDLSISIPGDNDEVKSDNVNANVNVMLSRHESMISPTVSLRGSPKNGTPTKASEDDAAKKGSIALSLAETLISPTPSLRRNAIRAKYDEPRMVSTGLKLPRGGDKKENVTLTLAESFISPTASLQGSPVAASRPKLSTVFERLSRVSTTLTEAEEFVSDAKSLISSVKPEAVTKPDSTADPPAALTKLRSPKSRTAKKPPKRERSIISFVDALGLSPAAKGASDTVGFAEVSPLSPRSNNRATVKPDRALAPVPLTARLTPKPPAVPKPAAEEKSTISPIMSASSTQRKVNAENFKVAFKNSDISPSDSASNFPSRVASVLSATGSGSDLLSGGAIARARSPISASPLTLANLARISRPPSRLNGANSVPSARSTSPKSAASLRRRAISPAGSRVASRKSLVIDPTRPRAMSSPQKHSSFPRPSSRISNTSIMSSKSARSTMTFSSRVSSKLAARMSRMPTTHSDSALQQQPQQTKMVPKPPTTKKPLRPPPVPPMALISASPELSRVSTQTSSAWSASSLQSAGAIPRVR